MSVSKTYAYHKPSQDGLVRISLLRMMFSAMHAEIEKQCPNSRERAVALTNLETAAMWAVKSVVCNDPESEVAE